MDVSSPRALDEWTFVDEDAEMQPPSPTVETREETTDGETIELSSPRDSALDEEAVPVGFLRVRIRIGEQTRSAYFKPTQGVQDFTRQFFTEELANCKRIRLIYMGMLLIQERTMGEYGIEEDGVIHAVINDAPPTPHPEASEDVVLKGLSNPANSLLLTTGLFLYGLWALLYHYPHLFSWKAIFLLATLSVVHVSTSVSRFNA